MCRAEFIGRRHGAAVAERRKEAGSSARSDLPLSVLGPGAWSPQRDELQAPLPQHRPRNAARRRGAAGSRQSNREGRRRLEPGRELVRHRGVLQGHEESSVRSQTGETLAPRCFRETTAVFVSTVAQTSAFRIRVLGELSGERLERVRTDRRAEANGERTAIWRRA